MEKKKSKTNLLQKFADKFKKKKRSRSAPTSKERTSEISKRKSRSPSKSKVTTGNSHGASTDNKTKTDTNRMEVTAKGFKKAKDAKKLEKKKEETGPSKTPSTIALRRAESQMELSGNRKNVEKGVKTWVEQLEKLVEIRKLLEADFKPIDTMKVDLEKCQAFKKNIDYCQSENVELYDANRVKGGGEADFFYHATVTYITSISTKSTILAQLPLSDSPHSLESFWLMVAAQKIQRLFILIGEDELDKAALSEYFPEDFKEFKTIRVNNRKTVSKSDEQPNTQLYYEVVPKDCAEAPFAMIEICDFWPDGKIPTVSYGRIAATAASVFDSDIDSDATCAIVSNYGAGRAGSFLVGVQAIEKLQAGDAPNIKEIAMSIRSQRPCAIETLPQYVFTYIIALTYGLKHVKDPVLKSKTEKVISQLEQFACEKMMEEDEEDNTTCE